MLRLLISEGQTVATQAELDRITEGRPADDFHLRAVAEAHFEQATPQLGVSTHRDDPAAATDSETVQSAGLNRAAVVAPGEVTCLPLLLLLIVLHRSLALC